MCPNTEFFWSVFSCIRTEYRDLFSPNTGKYGLQNTLYLDTFHAVNSWTKSQKILVFSKIFVKCHKILSEGSFPTNILCC